ncbi:MAG: hypothetical protein ACK5XN_39815 [Bacteroidota bacterium]|jgi:hypothetical protein
MKLLSKDNINIITDYINDTIKKRVSVINDIITSSEEYKNYKAQFKPETQELIDKRFELFEMKEIIDKQLDENEKKFMELENVGRYNIYSKSSLESWLETSREYQRHEKYKTISVGNDLTNKIKMALLELKEPDPEIAKEKVTTKMILEVFGNEQN